MIFICKNYIIWYNKCTKQKEETKMGLMNWLMKGIGFEGEEGTVESAEAIHEEKRKMKELKKQEKMARKLERQKAKNANLKKQLEPEEEEEQVSEQHAQISETSFPHDEPEQQTFDNNQYGSQSYGGYDGQSYGQTSMNTYGNKNIVFFYPKSYGEVKQLIDYLKQGESVMLNLDGIGDAEAQRMLDFSSGAVYAVNGSIKRVAGNIFLLTPEGLGIISNQKQ